MDGILKQAYAVPFKLTKENAVAALKKHYKAKVFFPDPFRLISHIQQIRGVYMPCCLFGCAIPSGKGGKF